MRESRLVRFANGVYLGTKNGEFVSTDRVGAVRFPTELLAQRYVHYLAGDEEGARAEIVPDRRPPQTSAIDACRVCGCNWEFACPGGCAWSEPQLCSRCAAEQRQSDGRAARRHAGDVPATIAAMAPCES